MQTLKEIAAQYPDGFSKVLNAQQTPHSVVVLKWEPGRILTPFCIDGASGAKHIVDGNALTVDI